MKKWSDTIGKTVIVRIGKESFSDVFGAIVEDIKEGRVLLSILDMDGFPTGMTEWYPLKDLTLLEVLE